MAFILFVAVIINNYFITCLVVSLSDWSYVVKFYFLGTHVTTDFSFFFWETNSELGDPELNWIRLDCFVYLFIIRRRAGSIWANRTRSEKTFILCHFFFKSQSWCGLGNADIIMLSSGTFSKCTRDLSLRRKKSFLIDFFMKMKNTPTLA